MNRIDQRFQDLKAKGESAFIPYITAGDPSLEATEAIMLALADAGADIIECGVPFSDPLGDGVVIQEAAQRALAKGVSMGRVFETVERVRAKSDVPLLLFTYYNPILAYGVERLAEDAARIGIDGVLCVDLPPDDAEEYLAHMKARGLCTVFLLAPTSTAERIEVVAKASTGFIYYVSRTGVTGERPELEASLNTMVSQIREHSDKPIAVGFGIGTPEQAAEVAGMADGVVVGSALVRTIASHGDSPDVASHAGAFARRLADAVKGRTQPATKERQGPTRSAS